jgi:MFS transporter, putative metabolite:H+ symporter
VLASHATSTQRITAAARLDRLPDSRYVRRLVILLSLGGCFEFYDLFFTAYIAPALYQSGIFTPTTKSFFGVGFASFIASLFAGMLVGTLLFSRVADRFGRRAIFSFSLLWYSAATFIMAFQSTATSIDLWRFIAGVGLGVEFVTIDVYISELVPKQTRGRAFAFNEFLTFLAVPFVAFVSWLLVPRHPLGLDGWRWVVIIGSLGAIFVWFIRRGIPESPRWLEQHGRQEEADRAMQEIEERVRRETGRDLEPLIPDQEEELSSGGGFREIFSRPYRQRTIVLSIFQLFQTLGFYGFATWAPTFLLSKGVNAPKSLEYTFLMAIASPFGPLLGRAFADKIERKWQIAGMATLIAIFGLLFSAQTAAVGVVLFGVLITLSSNWFSFAFHAYQSELYPTRVRAQAVGFVYSWSRLGAIFSSFVIAFFLRHYGNAGVFLLIALGMLIIVLVIGVWGPKTNRLRLEEIAR